MGQTVFIGNEVFKKPTWKAPQIYYSFNKDAECLKKLGDKNIPFIPKLTCTGTNSPFYGMTFMDGVSLTDNLHDLNHEEKDALASDIADSIINIGNNLPKKNGKLAKHADLRPDNILIDPITKKLTAIIDFGLIEYCNEEKLGDTSFWVKWFYSKSDLPEIISNKYKEKITSQKDGDHNKLATRKLTPA